jgi:hypothetical protein
VPAVLQQGQPFCLNKASGMYTVKTDIWFKHSFPDAGVQTRDESGFGQLCKSGFCPFQVWYKHKMYNWPKPDFHLVNAPATGNQNEKKIPS